jgi:hypothetical protein
MLPRVLSYGEADGGGSSSEGEGWAHDETERPGDGGSVREGIEGGGGGWLKGGSVRSL